VDFTSVEDWPTAERNSFKCDAFVVVYMINDHSSYTYALDYIERIKTARNAKNGELPMALIGNKCDLNSQREVDTSTARSKAAELEVNFSETSALCEIGINEVFNGITHQIIERKHATLQFFEDLNRQINGQVCQKKAKCLIS
jgi:GTPase SAR1 family protein